MSFLLYPYNALCWILRTTALHYGLIAFEMKSWKASMAVYASLYYVGQIVVVTAWLMGTLFGPKQPCPAGAERKTQ